MPAGQTATATPLEQKESSSWGSKLLEGSRILCGTNDGQEPRMVRVGDDPFALAHIWEQQLAQGVDPRRSKKQR